MGRFAIQTLSQCQLLICVLYPVQFRSVAQSCPTLCNPMNRSTPGLPVHHQLPEFTQTHIHWVSDAIQPNSSYLRIICDNYYHLLLYEFFVNILVDISVWKLSLQLNYIKYWIRYLNKLKSMRQQSKKKKCVHLVFTYKTTEWLFHFYTFIFIEI